jgi:hypothetical protein
VGARLAGILSYYEINPAELATKLHVVYLAEVNPLTYTLAQMRDDAAALNVCMLDWLRDYPGDSRGPARPHRRVAPAHRE